MWSACCSSCENKKSQEPGSFPSAPALEAAHDTLEANEGELKQELQELSHASGGVVEEPESKDVKGFFYEVNVDRQGLTGLGLQLEASDPRYCFVAAVKADGLIEIWNQQRKTDLPQVAASDRLVKVNGVAFPSQILVTKACGFGAFSLTFQRPRVFQVTVRKKTSWGLDIAASEQGLTIMAIQDGAIQEWNNEHPEREVHVGDRIVAAVARRSSVKEGHSDGAPVPRCTAVFTGDGSSVSDCLLETLQSRSLQGPVCMTIMSWSCGDDFDETSGY